MAKPATEAARAKKSRNKKKASGMKQIRIDVSEAEYNRIEELGKLRAGCRAPYDVNEYVTTLIRTVLPMDEAKYEAQVKGLGSCTFCKEVLPGGCGGTFKNCNDECYHTVEYKKVELQRVALPELDLEALLRSQIES